MLDERLDPVGRRDYLSQQHLARYEFARRHLSEGMSVLDIACGAGYGSAMMQGLGCEVTGGDYDEDVLKEAEKSWPGVRFVKMDAFALPFPDERFDAVVSFETIEHVVDGERFLAEMKRVLKPGGVFICSTPNIRYTSHPPYHLKEYSPEEYYELLTRHFPAAERAGQYFGAIDRLRDLLKWGLLPVLIRLLEITGLKPLLKTWLARSKTLLRPPAPANPSAPGSRAPMPVRNGRYDVVPVSPGAYRFLRIMVTVAVKQ